MQVNHMSRPVLLIGAGAMGRGIAYVISVDAKLHVSIVDTSQSAIEQCINFIVKSASRKGHVEEEVRNRIRTFSSISEAVKHDTYELAIETATENIAIKKQLFKQLVQHTQKSTILATNTSSLSVTVLAESLPAADRARIVGMHFFNPANKIKGMEVIPSRYTSKEVTSQIMGICKSFGKTPVLCTQDIPGFIVNRVLNASFLEALHLVEIGAGSPTDIDKLMRTTAGWSMGPFQVADLVGLDVMSFVQQNIYEGSGKDPKYKPSPLLQALLKSNKLGLKTGEGFFRYNKL